MAVLYRGSQENSRSAVGPVGDRCDWFEVDAESIRDVASDPGPDPVLFDETLMRLIEHVIRAAYERHENELAPPNDDHRTLVDDAKTYIGTHFTEHISLADVGRVVGASPFHLARLFRKITGRTIHQHLTDLRLRAALDELGDAASNITDIALRVGFASHSHMTKVFHSRFGMTPSQFRGHPTDYLRTIVIA